MKAIEVTTTVQAEQDGFTVRFKPTFVDSFRKASTLPMPGKRNGSRSVMPVWHDVHRACDTTLLAYEATTDRRPWKVLRQGVQSDVDHVSTQFPPEHSMLQVRWPSAIHSAGPPGGYLPVHRSRCVAIADDSAARDVTQIINPLWIETVVGYRSS